MVYAHLLGCGSKGMLYPSPLRFPGGKRKIAEFISDCIVLNGVQGGTYIEPFVGGGNVALFLLLKEVVNNIVINDLDRSIYAFWHSVLFDTDNLCGLIEDTPITMDEWHIQKEIQTKKAGMNLLDLGFSTFFLNRTNRSGILNGGVIGGKQQNGVWKMDARFRKDSLIKRIEKIAGYKNRIELYNLDAMELINTIQPSLGLKSFIYFDPPYYNQGATLYSNHFTHEDHEKLAEFIKSLDSKWILTYDYTPQIIEMYQDTEKRLLTLNYTAIQKMKGKEMLAYCDGFVLPTGAYPSIKIE